MFTTSASDLMLGQAADNAQVKGMLIPISYLDPENRDTACSRFQLGFAESICSYPNSQFKYSWIALVRRGACALTEKVRNAQAIGAMAIVVNEDDQIIENKMNKSEDLSDIYIPVFIVKSSTYRSLQMAVSYNGKSFAPKSEIFKEEGLVIAIIRNGKEFKNLLVRTNVVIFLILFLVALLMASCSVRNIRKLTPSLFTVLPVIKYDQLNICSINETICAICLEEFKSGDDMRMLPSCKHFYHSQCIDSWLVKSKKCPICRKGVGETHLNIS